MELSSGILDTMQYENLLLKVSLHSMRFNKKSTAFQKIEVVAIQYNYCVSDSHPELRNVLINNFVYFALLLQATLTLYLRRCVTMVDTLRSSLFSDPEHQYGTIIVAAQNDAAPCPVCDFPEYLPNSLLQIFNCLVSMFRDMLLIIPHREITPPFLRKISHRTWCRIILCRDNDDAHTDVLYQ
ncbi:hypothetical protein ANN_16120 [Periplaneta americana]|uniref:Uncharacterized protein n=1 Tax=Periplaneta americana TaxID=6978 RepID=A0ABQ8SIJ3_PERAM|nr:hypothetical protein ANN_16120 [Periplaneta americana]